MEDPFEQLAKEAISGFAEKNKSEDVSTNIDAGLATGNIANPDSDPVVLTMAIEPAVSAPPSDKKKKPEAVKKSIPVKKQKQGGRSAVFETKFADLKTDLTNQLVKALENKNLSADTLEKLLAEQEDLLKKITSIPDEKHEKGFARLQIIEKEVEEFLKKTDAVEGLADDLPLNPDDFNMDIEPGDLGDPAQTELIRQLEANRWAYIKKDVEAERKASVFRKLFKLGSLGQYSQEHEEVKSKYYESLKACVAKRIERGRDTKEMVAFLEVGEYFSRESMRADIRAENSSWGEKAVDGYMKMVNRYRAIGENDSSKKVKFAKKILAGLAVGGVATGVALGGGLVAGAAGSIVGATAVRMFSLSVSATGFKAIAEKMADSAREKNSVKKSNEISKEAGFDADILRGKLNEIIENIDSDMQKNKQTARLRTLGSFLTATVISDLGQYFGPKSIEAIKHYFQHEPAIPTGVNPAGTGVQEVAKTAVKGMAAEKIHEVGAVHESGAQTFNEAVENSNAENFKEAAERAGEFPPAAHTETFAEAMERAGEIPSHPAGGEDVVSGHNMPSVGEGIDHNLASDGQNLAHEIGGKLTAEENIIEIKQGGNIEASIRDFYRSHPDALKAYQEATGKKLTPGQIAHRIFLEYGDDRDLVHAGAKIHLSADGQDITQISGDPNMGHLQHAVSGAGHEAMAPVAEVPATATEIPAVETATPVVEIPDFKIDETFSEGFLKFNHEIDVVSADVAKFDSAIIEAYHQIDTSGHLTPEELVNLDVDDIRPFNVLDVTKSPEMLAAEKTNLKYLISQKIFLGEQLNKLVEGRSFMHVKNIRKYIGGGSMLNWMAIQNQSMEELLANKKETTINKFFEYLTKSDGIGMNKLRESIKPKTAETVSAWVTRVVKTANLVGVKKL